MRGSREINDLPVVLGIEWIVQSGASVKGINGRAEVILPSLHSAKETRSLDTMSPVAKMETERVKEDSTAEDVALKVLVQKLACIPEDDSEEEKANDFSQEAENLRVLGAIIDEASFNIPVRPKCCLKPMRSKRIPAGTQGFVSCRVPDENQRWCQPLELLPLEENGSLLDVY